MLKIPSKVKNIAVGDKIEWVDEQILVIMKQNTPTPMGMKVTVHGKVIGTGDWFLHDFLDPDQQVYFLFEDE